MYNPSNNDIDDTDIDELLEDIAGGRCNVSGAVQKISAQWLEEFIDYGFLSPSFSVCFFRELYMCIDMHIHIDITMHTQQHNNTAILYVYIYVNI